MYPKSPTTLLFIVSKQKINLMNGQMAKETRYDFSMGLLMRIIFKIFSLIFSGFLLLGPTYLWISNQVLLAPMSMLEFSEWCTQAIYTKLCKLDGLSILKEDTN